MSGVLPRSRATSLSAMEAGAEASVVVVTGSRCPRVSAGS